LSVVVFYFFRSASGAKEIFMSNNFQPRGGPQTVSTAWPWVPQTQPNSPADLAFQASQAAAFNTFNAAVGAYRWVDPKTGKVNGDKTGQIQAQLLSQTVAITAADLAAAGIVAANIVFYSGQINWVNSVALVQNAITANAWN
jgi:hypothetical protein